MLYRLPHPSLPHPFNEIVELRPPLFGEWTPNGEDKIRKWPLFEKHTTIKIPTNIFVSPIESKMALLRSFHEWVHQTSWVVLLFAVEAANRCEADT